MTGRSTSEVCRYCIPLTLIVLVLCAIMVYRTHRGWTMSTRTAPPALRLDPNTARWEELAAMPDIGPSLAKAIVARREALQSDGRPRPFATLKDLDTVPGVGPRTLEAIERHLVFEADDSLER